MCFLYSFMYSLYSFMYSLYSFVYFLYSLVMLVAVATNIIGYTTLVLFEPSSNDLKKVVVNVIEEQTIPLLTNPPTISDANFTV